MSPTKTFLLRKPKLPQKVTSQIKNEGLELYNIQKPSDSLASLREA